jgi:hypothetical protein
MQVIAFVLALIAVVMFLLAAYGASRPNPPWHFGWLGLAILTVAWMVQLIVQSSHTISTH